MKERITFIHDRYDAFDPKQLHLEGNRFSVKSLRAAREHRFTIGLYELPQEIWRGLKQCHELHIRWATSQPHQTIAPFVSTVAPGLHILYTPQKGLNTDLLCPLLQKVLGDTIECTPVEETFTRPTILSERFASSAAYQFYTTLNSLEDLIIYIQQKICTGDERCKAQAACLQSTNYLDFDFDAISQSVTLSAFWSAEPASGTWDEDISNGNGSQKVEVGVLANEKPTQPEEISLGGFLAVLGEDRKPSPTLFSFPSRHHRANTNFSTQFIQPTGLHPTLRITLPRSVNPPLPQCALHAYLTAPSYLFIDQYQLSSPNYLASRNLRSIRSLSGETNLEAPDWATSKWGSALLLEFAHPTPLSNPDLDNSWYVDIPFHLRYLKPRGEPRVSHGPEPEAAGGHRNVSMPWPNVFWACPTDEGTKMNTNPFDRVNLGYDGLFGPRTMLYHLQAVSLGKPLMAEFEAPVMNMEKVIWVEAGTVITVSLGFLWVISKLLRVFWRDWTSNTARERPKKE